ncbi:MAG: hypothetical protein ACRCWY_01680 [Cellulosilyticaceae bacterium]
MSSITCQLFNHSDMVLSELYLCADTLPPFLQSCTILRERGSFAFNAPFSDIPLGNLYPLEICTLAFEWLDTNGSLSENDVLLFLSLDSPVTLSQPLEELFSVSFLNI